eukprot:247390-Chlamydomonas_euryale.AAC.2
MLGSTVHGWTSSGCRVLGRTIPGCTLYGCTMHGGMQHTAVRWLRGCMAPGRTQLCHGCMVARCGWSLRFMGGLDGWAAWVCWPSVR